MKTIKHWRTSLFYGRSHLLGFLLKKTSALPEEKEVCEGSPRPWSSCLGDKSPCKLVYLYSSTHAYTVPYLLLDEYVTIYIYIYIPQLAFRWKKYSLMYHFPNIHGKDPQILYKEEKYIAILCTSRTTYPLLHFSYYYLCFIKFFKLWKMCLLIKNLTINSHY